MKLIAGQAEYDVFPFWDHCALRMGNCNYVICAMDSDSIDMREINPNLVGVPTALIKLGTSGKLRAFPKPDRDYQVIVV